MTTLAEFTLRVAKEVTDVLRSTATAGSATTLTDTLRLKQPVGYWEGGTCWLLSGSHSGKVVEVTTYSGNVITFSTLTTSVGTARYAMCDKLFPWSEMIKAAMSALEEEGAWILTSNTTLLGDGETLEFSLPAGVYGVESVELVDTDATPDLRYAEMHWRERNGTIFFEVAPYDGYRIDLFYRTPHADLTTYSDVIDDEISTYWLKWKTVANLMLWALSTYGDSPEKRYANKLQVAMEALKGSRARPVVIELRTA